MDNPQAIAKYINCLSILEDKTAVLYNKLSERVETALTKSLLLSISKDSSKHSILLKGIADSISDSKQNHKDCAKKFGELWKIVTSYLNEVNEKNKMGKISFSELLPKLTALESSLGEEYYIFVQMKTLQLMAKEINRLYGIDLEKMKKVLEGIIKDEEHHREILATINAIISKTLAKKDDTPIVKYENPDAWIHSLPPTTYDSK